MNKAELRKVYQLKRKELSPKDVEAGSIVICNHFFSNFQIGKINSIHIFLPILLKNEINTYCIINRLSVEFPNVKIVIPKIEGQDVQSCLLTPETVLKNNSLGIPEPDQVIPFVHQQLDLIVIPLLAFDKKGNRLGYGKGFYDRFLTTCRQDAIKVGISLFEAEESIQSESFDVPLDFCITPKQLYTFGV
jgi:5-formyltetrahydrofolate cyclo-ligase